MRIAIRMLNLTLSALILLVVNHGQAPAATCDIFNCITHHDVIPNFAGQPTIRSIQNGAWSSAATWNLGRLPNATDVVAIGSGTSVIYDAAAGTAKIVGIEANGRLTFRTDVSTRLTVGTLLVLPQGSLQVGTPLAPIAANATAEIVIAN